MNIVLLQDDYPPRHVGGAGAVAHTQAKELVRQGHEVLVVTAVQKKEDVGGYTIDGVRVQALFSSYPQRLRAWRSLHNPAVVHEVQKIFDEYKPDVVHAHNVHLHLSYASLKLAKDAGARVGITFHDAMSYTYGKAADAGRVVWWRQWLKYRRYYNPFRNHTIRRSLAYTDTRLVVSAALQEALAANGIAASVLYNGIDTTEWSANLASIEEFKNKYNLHNKKVVFFGGRLSREKGGEAAVRMLAHVAQHEPAVVLLVAGKKDGYGEAMHTLAAELGIGTNIVFTGWISGAELRAAYHASSAVVVPSLYLDPLPTVVLEAMACHKPVVATNRGGAKEMVVNGETGFVVDPTDTAAFAQQVTTLLTDETKAAQFGKAGYERVTKKFNLATQTAQYLAQCASSKILQ